MVVSLAAVLTLRLTSFPCIVSFPTSSGFVYLFTLILHDFYRAVQASVFSFSFPLLHSSSISNDSLQVFALLCFLLLVDHRFGGLSLVLLLEW